MIVIFVIAVAGKVYPFLTVDTKAFLASSILVWEI
jgi:hypothetical protein